MVGAAVMLYGFLPLAMRRPCKPPPAKVLQCLTGKPASVRWVALGLAAGAAAILAVRGLPGVVTDHTVLRPRHCEAFAAIEEYQREMLPERDRACWIPVVARGREPADLTDSLRAADAFLVKLAATDARLLGHYLPLALAPDPAHQQANGPALLALAAERERIFRAADKAGVTEQGLSLARSVFDLWQAWGREATPVRWPHLGRLEGILGPQLHHDEDGWTACGYLRIDKTATADLTPVLDQLEALPGIELGGWDYLGAQLASLLGSESRRVLWPAGGILAVLWLLVFRSWRERLVAASSLAFAGLMLVAAMRLFGIAWNFVNIGSIPLCLGLGLDFHIHMIHSLRNATLRGEDTRAVSRALAYCGLSTALGFGTLAMSDNAGLASFGMCAMIGVFATLFSAAFLVPAIWQLATPPELPAGNQPRGSP
jgi:hypothetical protein